MKLTVDRKLTPAEIAEAFCELNDEEQAQVFIEAARIAAAWDADAGPAMQWYRVGKHIASCACSTYEARAMVRDIAEAAEANT